MGYTLTSEVKARERGMCTLATNLRGITRNSGILCQNIRAMWYFCLQNRGGKTSIRRALITATNEALSTRKVETAFTAASIFLSNHFGIWETLLLRLLFMPVGLVSLLPGTKYFLGKCREVLAFSS